MNLPPLPYDDTKLPMVKAQAMVSERDKDLLMTVLPNRGLHTLLIQHAFKRAADFIRREHLTYDPNDTTSQRRLLDHVTSTGDTHRGPPSLSPPGETNPRDVSGRAAKIRRAHKDLSNQSADI